MDDTAISGRRFRHFLVSVAAIRKKPRHQARKEVYPGKLGKIEDNLAEILDSQKLEAGRISELNRMISKDFESTRLELSNIENELELIQQQTKCLKDLPEAELNSIKRRISRVKSAVESLKN